MEALSLYVNNREQEELLRVASLESNELLDLLYDAYPLLLPPTKQFLKTCFNQKEVLKIRTCLSESPFNYTAISLPQFMLNREVLSCIPKDHLKELAREMGKTKIKTSVTTLSTAILLFAKEEWKGPLLIELYQNARDLGFLPPVEILNLILPRIEQPLKTWESFKLVRSDALIIYQETTNFVFVRDDFSLAQKSVFFYLLTMHIPFESLCLLIKEDPIRCKLTPAQSSQFFAPSLLRDVSKNFSLLDYFSPGELEDPDVAKYLITAAIIHGKDLPVINDTIMMVLRPLIEKPHYGYLPLLPPKVEADKDEEQREWDALVKRLLDQESSTSFWGLEP